MRSTYSYACYKILNSPVSLEHSSSILFDYLRFLGNVRKDLNLLTVRYSNVLCMLQRHDRPVTIIKIHE